MNGWLQSSGLSSYCALAALSLACGAAAGSGTTEEQTTVEDAAPAVVVNAKGSEFLRIDQWDPNELDRILEAAVSEPGQPVTPEKLAAQLRGQMAAHGAWYVETEAPLELAERILAGGGAAVIEPATQAQVGRYIWGYDHRVGVGSSLYMFSERGCSGTLIGQETGVTAAHCVFDTRTSQGFFCDTNTRGSQGTGGSAFPTPFTHLVSLQGNTCNGTRRYARWRVGVSGMNGVSGWMGPSDCMRIAIPTGYVVNVDESNFLDASGAAAHYELARWDYAALDMGACPAFQNVGAVGTQSMTNSQLLAANAMSLGYPMYAGCGNSGGGRPDCPNQSQFMQYLDANGFKAGLSSPYFGASLWRAIGDDIEAGQAESADTIYAPKGATADYTLDTSPGNSGGALVVGGNLIGIASLGAAVFGGGQVNVWHRWNTETNEFLATHTQYPED